MIDVHMLSCGYSDKVIVKDIDFSSAGNMIVLGPNGAGKSTLAKALCGLLPHEGTIFLDGNELRQMTPHERAKQIAYIPSKLDVFDVHTTVEEFVLLGRYPYKAAYRNYDPEDYELVEQTVRRVGIEALQQQRVHELSSGQQQLALIAQALAQQSRILIFDEPTANLDPAHTVAFVQQLHALQHSHQTVLITHNLHLASQLEGTVLFVDGGGARFYEEARSFFTAENLEQCYGVGFDVSEKGVGVRYG